MYRLDTDILSNLLKRLPSVALIAKLASVLPEHQFYFQHHIGGADLRGTPAPSRYRLALGTAGPDTSAQFACASIR